MDWIYDESGSGQPVLLLHGIPGSRKTWRSVSAQLAAKYRVIAPDLTGFGDAPPLPWRGFHAAEEAGHLARNISTMKLQRIHVVGFDFGGPTAVALLKLIPGRLTSLTLIATNVFTDTPIPLPLRPLRWPLFGELMSGQMFSRAGTALLYRAATGDRSRFPFRDFWSSSGGSQTRRSTRAIFLDSLRNLQQRYGEIQATLDEIEIPTAVIWGDRDPFFSTAQALRTAAAIDGSTLTILKGCGHFVPQERAGELSAALLQHFENSEKAAMPRAERLLSS